MSSSETPVSMDKSQSGHYFPSMSTVFSGLMTLLFFATIIFVYLLVFKGIFDWISTSPVGPYRPPNQPCGCSCPCDCPKPTCETTA